jgi:endonuclease/exonuclease/phosphatase family metal-dependent hydrolase
MLVAQSAATVGPFRDMAGEQIQLVDQNVILANTNRGGQGFQFVHHRQGVFSEHSTLQLGGPQGPQLPIFSSWATVEIASGDHSFRIVTTRLDPFDPSVNVAQAQELATGLTQTNLPMVFTGDYSSPAGSATYGVMLGAGFHDAWMRKHAADPGATAVEPDLRDAGRSLEARTDFVFIQAGITDGNARLLGVSPLDRTPSGLWPSNHAGLLAQLVLP